MQDEKKVYVEVDNNMKIETTIKEKDIVFYDVRKPPFTLHGFYDPINEPYFHRLPTELGESVSAKVSVLEKESSGGCVRFSTDSAYVAIKAEYKVPGFNSHIPLAESAGFDLYCDSEFESRYVQAFLPPKTVATDGDMSYESLLPIRGEKKMRYFTINFPIHSCIKNLYVGLQDSAVLGEELPYSKELPVVVYGSSIVHGTAASRPGLTYTNMLRRKLNIDVLNVGFSGNAKSEDAIITYLRDLPMSVFVYDYDHNAPNVDHLKNTHLRAYQRFREVHPDIPFIMVSSPNVVTNKNWSHEVYSARRSVIMDTYKYAIERGDKHVYYIDGEGFFMGHEENDCTMDSIHPNDMGFSKMADHIACMIKAALNERS